MAVEVVADGRDAEDTDEVADPDRGVEQAELDASESRVDGFEDHGSVGLHSVANADDAEVHDKQRPEAPVDHHVP